MVKYAVLNESLQLFASKYMRYLPTVEALRDELERKRALLVREDWRVTRRRLCSHRKRIDSMRFDRMAPGSSAAKPGAKLRSDTR